MHSSPVSYNDTTYRLAVKVGIQIWGLAFPATTNDAPSVVKLSNISETGSRCIIGVHKAYTFCEEGTGLRIGYNWDDWGRTPSIRHFKGNQRWVRHLLFDEEIGRIVYLTGGGIAVVDYIL